jgi:1-acyl-sn-glycerol-3-phosphate acyltransferase
MVPPIPPDAQALDPRPITREARANVPRYRLPARVMGQLISAAAMGRKRSLARDARAAMKGVSPRPQVLGMAHVPAEGACLVTCNHYTRPGLGAWWIALSISEAVAACRAPQAPSDLHWVMTAAWRYSEGDWRRRVVTPLTEWAFARAARVYDFVTMPPMPPAPDEVEARASAVLRTVRLARGLVDEGGLLGLAPEGRDTPGLLDEAPRGAGDFIALLVGTGMPVLPAGIAEQGGRLRISFGAPYVPEIPRQRPARDRAVIDQVMAAIAAQLP